VVKDAERASRGRRLGLDAGHVLPALVEIGEHGEQEIGVPHGEGAAFPRRGRVEDRGAIAEIGLGRPSDVLSA